MTTPRKAAAAALPPALPFVLTLLLALAGCSSVPLTSTTPPARVPAPVAPGKAGTKPEPGVPVLPAAGSGRGGYYQDDGPGDSPPANLAAVPDAEVRNDPPLPRSNRPYVVFGKTYTPITDNQPFSQRGIGSWYGKKFHGQRTSSGELYDMYKMTAAHPTLPIPSYARLTNLVSGNQVVVRINDRGPFHSNRVIDVSYTAALKLGLLGKGSHELQIERILPAEVERMQAGRGAKPQPQPQPLEAQPQPQLVLVPVAVPTAVPALASAAAAPLTPGFYLQLGAYTRAENAESVRNRLQQAGVALLEVVQGGSVYRLFSGPFASRQDASQAAQGLPAVLSLKPIVIQR
ncbi:septal ring lytic transglycosylase RlpA family protein [Rugamonas sp. CCM 8940]|uniref:septal ring lytic transglycosylase RlpA family protein n=1 Tax=Rugamonas sp. CCM 8940 TaxID=2765359 RepID=UPI0018F73157|nr:septal ring lytic transglycosylase RlpA family protein [Rugamonas sp. CCM 8940]MBJ7314212.1 septal ring lytic transglycosylase RlpA family protein [Rugamonas sp. CCM 8940]